MTTNFVPLHILSLIIALHIALVVQQAFCAPSENLFWRLSPIASSSVRQSAADVARSNVVGIKHDEELWPSETTRRAWPLAVVPYTLSGLDPRLRHMLRTAIIDIERLTCVNFIPRTNEAEYVLFRGVDFGCFVSTYGREKDSITIVALGDECFNSGIGTIHALIMRSLGFGFEHLRLDRNDYLIVHLDRMFGHAMRERFKPDVEPVLDYDYGSVLHLAADAFAKDDAGGPTLEAKRALPPGVVMGQRNGLSPGDVAKIRFIYNCSNAYPLV